jgi:hypothetical protein
VAGAPAVIAGFGGGLISHAYVEERLLPSVDRAAVAPFERRFVRWWAEVARSLGPASGTRAILDAAAIPLMQLLDYERPVTTPSDLGLLADLARQDSFLIVVPWSVPTASVWRDALRRGLAADRSWALVCNGRSLRVVDCTRSWTRAAIEFDFDRLAASPSGIAALWMLANARQVGAAGPGSLRARIEESDAHQSRVCRSLAGGVLSALPALTTALAQGGRARIDRMVAFDQALTLVYRILFLLFAEARALVPIWNDVYHDGYSLDALTGRAARRAPGLWKAFQAISRLAHAGCSAGDLRVTAFNGRLFSPRHAPLVEQRRVPDAVMRDVLLDLATEVTSSGRQRISYHDLGVEQLGSVYEHVLEHEPVAEGGAVVLTRTSSQRKTTGSFYTPRALTDFLVRRTLAPLVENRTADHILQLRIVDPSMGSGAFLVAACLFLADACEQALIRDGQWAASDVTPADRALLRRQVAERCMYGVDLNPTAVQLARVSLWLTTLAAERPLTFLDHHLAVGNSLIGAWLRDLHHPPVSSKRPRAITDLPLFADQIADEVAAQVLPMRLRLAEPSDSLDIVKGKERTMSVLASDRGPIARWSAAADAWCAAALWPGGSPPFGVVREWIAAATGASSALSERQLRPSLDRARGIAAGHAAFHWELAFPEVFFAADGQPAADGGFDAVIGNPPWDMLRADIGSRTERRESKTSTASLLRFCRTSRGYRHLPTGQANSYQLFLDRAIQLARNGGRIGLILPSGLATDHGSAPLRRHLFDHTAIDTWIGFDNRCRIFPIHRSMRFLIMATTKNGVTESLRFRCGLSSVNDLDRDGAIGAPLVLSRSRIESLDRDHLTVPEVTDPTALGILTSIADRVPALGDPRAWAARFGRELNATDDRSHFVSPGRANAMLIVEGKQLTPFQVDLARSSHAISVRSASRRLDGAATYSRARIAYRDVAGATNKLTLIAAMLPANVVSTHTVFCLKSGLEPAWQWCLLGLMNSLVANYLVRLNVTTHVTASLMSRLPVPKPAADSRAFKRLASLARALASTGIVGDSREYAELNAIAAELYGLSTEDFRHVLNSFPLLPRSLRDACFASYVRATELRMHLR